MVGGRDIIGTYTGGPLVVHGEQACAGQACCIHNPSDHPLNTQPLHWRGDRRLMERLCEHGIGHPDPDDLAHHRNVHGADASECRGIHGCDGCCSGTQP